MGENSQNSSIIRLSANTWSRDSHDLYDYEADPQHDENLVIKASCKILRDSTHIFARFSTDARDASELIIDHLFTIRAIPKEGSSSFPQYEVIPAEKGTHQGLNHKKLWKIVRYLPDKKYIIQENDLLKLGRCKLKVRQLITPKIYPNNSNSSVLNYNEFPSIEASMSINDMQNLQCRICLCEGGTDDDPLIKSCQCKGTIEYIHVSCLKTWYEQKQDNNNDHSSTCFCLKLQRCELCKQTFPVVIKTKTNIIKLFQIPSTLINSTPLIVLENLVGNTPKAYHIISIERQVKLGRGHECDVRIADVSISRHHATISFDNDCFTIQDEKSKFGTLVSLKQPLPITQKEELAIQAGRSVLKLQLADLPNSNDQTSISSNNNSEIQL